MSTPWFRAKLEDGGTRSQDRDIVMGTNVSVTNVDTTGLENEDLVVELAKLIGEQTDNLSYDAIQREYGPRVEERLVAERAPDGTLNVVSKKVHVYRSMEERKAFFRKMKEVTRQRLAVQSEAYAQGYHLGDTVAEMELEEEASEQGNAWTQWDNALNYTKAYRKPLKFRMRIRPDELRTLIQAAKSSDACMKNLLVSVEPLVNKSVFHYAKKYDEDLVQEANLGVIKAVKAFDSKIAGDAIAFMAKHINGAICEAMIADTMGVNGVEAVTVEKQIKLKKLHDALQQKLARDPTLDELIAVAAKTSLGIMTKTQVSDILAMRRPLSTDYLLTDNDGDSITLLEKLGDDDIAPVPGSKAPMSEAEVDAANLARVTQLLGGGDKGVRDALKLIGFFKGTEKLTPSEASKLQGKVKLALEKEVK